MLFADDLQKNTIMDVQDMSNPDITRKQMV